MAKTKVNLKNRKKNSKQTALVVYKTPSQRPVQKQNKKRNALSGDLGNYKAALSDPFGAKASAARVPDMYACPTTTRRITRAFTLVSDANGDADVLLMPNAFVHALSTRGNIPSGSGLMTAGDGSTYQAVFTSTSVLMGALANYRVVGYGVRVVGLQAENTAAGKFQAATLPSTSWVNGISPVGGQAATRVDPAQTIGAWLSSMGVPNTSNKVDITAIPTLTTSVLGSVNRLNDTPLQITPKITSPEAFNFRLSGDSPIGFMANDQTSASYILAGDASYLRISGHESVLFALTGCPPSTAIAELEVIYHLEGTAAVVGSTGIQQSTDKVVVNPTGWMKVVQEVSQMSPFRMMVESAGNAIVPGLGTLANRLF